MRSDSNSVNFALNKNTNIGYDVPSSNVICGLDPEEYYIIKQVADRRDVCVCVCVRHTLWQPIEEGMGYLYFVLDVRPIACGLPP